MLLRILSDLHNEFGGLNIIPVLPDENETVCILAGDIGVAIQPVSYVSFVSQMSKRFKDVIYVLGNHEYYKGDYYTTFVTIKNNLDPLELANVTLIGDKVIVLPYEEEKIAIISTTLWTSMDNRNPITMLAAIRGINDYHVVKKGGKVLQPHDTVTVHEETVEELFTQIVHWKNKGWKVVVVTHHAPSELSTLPQFKGNKLDGTFRSNLEYAILDSQPNLWVHGHMHNTSDYMLGETRVVCNPHGYPHELNQSFDSKLTIEV